VSSSARTRKRNARGQGDRLRGEIVEAALRLVDAAGADAITLRAVAREAGIAAPSIYDHFADVDGVVRAVIERCFADLTAEIVAARDRLGEPVARLEAGCGAYLAYAERCPQRYALLFRHVRPANEAPVGEAAFDTLVAGVSECVTAGRSISREPFQDAVALWCGLHGHATLRATVPGFPWPAEADTATRLIHGLGRIVSAAPSIS
jgi:AcrR family transcriptional regulator